MGDPPSNRGRRNFIPWLVLRFSARRLPRNLTTGPGGPRLGAVLALHQSWAELVWKEEVPSQVVEALLV